MPEWYPQKASELNNILTKFLSQKVEITDKEIHGIIVPHAGYEYSGEIAGKAYALLKNSPVKQAIIFGPSHYIGFDGLMAIKKIDTPIDLTDIPENDYMKLEHEHSVENQFPFLQKLGFNEILPLVVGDITQEEAKEIAEKYANEKKIFIFSTDLSHFFPYEKAINIDKKTIEIIENLNLEKIEDLDACGKHDLMIMMHLCKINNWQPHLIEYKNSGDVTGEKDSVVGYASFYF